MSSLYLIVILFNLNNYASFSDNISSTENFVGSWNLSSSVTDSILKSIEPDALPSDIGMNVDLLGTITFSNSDNTYHRNLIFTIEIINSNGRFSLSVLTIDNGTWNINSTLGVITFTMLSSEYKPLDEFTTIFDIETPDFINLFAPVVGESESFSFVFTSTSSLELTEPNTDIKYFMTKKGSK